MAKGNRAEWAKRVERWVDSGLTAKEFAAEMGLKASTLSYWKWRLRSEGHALASAPKRRRREREAGFIEVTAVSGDVEPADRPVLELVVGDVTVRVPMGFDQDTLQQLLVVVRQT